MLYFADIAFVLSLIAVAMGVGILHKLRKPNTSEGFFKFLGYFVTILALLMLLLTFGGVFKSFFFEHSYGPQKYAKMHKEKGAMHKRGMESRR